MTQTLCDSFKLNPLLFLICILVTLTLWKILPMTLIWAMFSKPVCNEMPMGSSMPFKLLSSCIMGIFRLVSNFTIECQKIKDLWYPSNRWVFLFIHQSSEVYPGMQPKALSQIDSGFCMKSSMVGDEQNIFVSVCEPAYACYQGKGNKHQYLLF